jgi:hypothetical protein
MNAAVSVVQQQRTALQRLLSSIECGDDHTNASVADMHTHTPARKHRTLLGQQRQAPWCQVHP